MGGLWLFYPHYRWYFAPTVVPSFPTCQNCGYLPSNWSTLSGLWDETITEAARISRLRKIPLGIQQSSLLHRDLFRLEPPHNPQTCFKVTLITIWYSSRSTCWVLCQPNLSGLENPQFDASSPCSSLKSASGGGYTPHFQTRRGTRLGCGPSCFMSA